MKISSFIGKRHLPLTDADVSAFKDTINDIFSLTDWSVSEVHNQTECVFNPAYPNVDRNFEIRATYIITHKSGMPVLGRNGRGDRMYIKSIKINIDKKTDDNGIVQFSMWEDNTERVYIIESGSKYMTRDIVQPYNHDASYGTEMSDFVNDEFKISMRAMLSMKRQTPAQIRKLVMDFIKRDVEID